MEPRFEFTFSYWIFAWFLLYYFGATPFNPKIWLIIALSLNILGEINRIIFTKWTRTWSDNFTYIIANIIIKVTPIWILRDSPFKLADFVAGIGLFFVFIFWMFFRLGSINAILTYQKDVKDRLTEKKAATPLINLLHKWNVI